MGCALLEAGKTVPEDGETDFLWAEAGRSAWSLGIEFATAIRHGDRENALRFARGAIAAVKEHRGKMS